MLVCVVHRVKARSHQMQPDTHGIMASVQIAHPDIRVSTRWLDTEVLCGTASRNHTAASTTQKSNFQPGYCSSIQGAHSTLHNTAAHNRHTWSSFLNATIILGSNVSWLSTATVLTRWYAISSG
jgi:hypothetical protein